MPISIASLRNAATRSYRIMVAKSLSEARARRQQTAFLCHSHKDTDLAEGLQVMLNENGWELYIDWKDVEMPENPNRETAKLIQSKIRELDWFLFLATPNSTSSKWCPWEIGYADSTKTLDKIIIIPTIDNTGKWYGNEYLQLYRKIDIATDGSLAAFPAGQESGSILVKNLRFLI